MPIGIYSWNTVLTLQQLVPAPKHDRLSYTDVMHDLLL